MNNLNGYNKCIEETDSMDAYAIQQEAIRLIGMDYVEIGFLQDLICSFGPRNDRS